jgi:hypothetical protein
MLTVALIFAAQQTASGSAEAAQQKPGQPSAQNAVDQHMKALTERIGLSVEQQAQMRPILQQMMDARQKLMQDSSLSEEARHEKMKTMHERADKQARTFLSDEQKKKLDEFEQEAHGTMRGNGEGKTAPPVQ